MQFKRSSKPSEKQSGPEDLWYDLCAFGWLTYLNKEFVPFLDLILQQKQGS